MVTYSVQCKGPGWVKTNLSWCGHSQQPYKLTHRTSCNKAEQSQRALSLVQIISEANINLRCLFVFTVCYLNNGSLYVVGTVLNSCTTWSTWSQKRKTTTEPIKTRLVTISVYIVDLLSLTRYIVVYVYKRSSDRNQLFKWFRLLKTMI